MFRSKKQPTPPTFKVDYPSGIAISTESGVFYVRGNKRYKIPTDRIQKSWRFSQIVPSTEAAARHLKVSGTLGFRDGSHVVDISDMKHYIISESKRRHIVDPDVWMNLGLDPKKAVVVSAYEISLHQPGEVLK